MRQTGQNIMEAAVDKVRFIPGLIFAALLLGGGCSARNAASDYAEGYTEDEELEEIFFQDALEEDSSYELVEAIGLPQDDGMSMTPAERAAFYSTGYLDAGLTPEDLQPVERHFKYYLHERRGLMELYLSRAEQILPYLRQTFLAHGVPEEIIYLAAVESGFSSQAVSRAGATGMWQFMRVTGLRYGLGQNIWIDERRDPYKATEAAAAYLKKLYALFGDWHLAVAAYNAGEGKIQRALRNTGAQSFFELYRLNEGITQQDIRLKQETQQYVPRLLAVTKIMRNLEALGLRRPDESRMTDVRSFTLGPGTDLNALAKNIGLAWDEFRRLNPAFRRHISPPDTESIAYVPAVYSAKTSHWLAGAGSSRFAGWQAYRVRRGDSLSSLSARYGVPQQVLARANNMKGAFLREGSALLVPGGRPRSPAPAPRPTAGADRPATVAAGRAAPVSSPSLSPALSSQPAALYLVRRGDSLYSIAHAHGVSLDSLRAANNIPPGESRLLAGRRLNIPAATRDKAEAAGKEAKGAGFEKLIVRRGDTLYGIAARNNTSVEELLRLNGLKADKPILPGQEIKLPQ